MPVDDDRLYRDEQENPRTLMRLAMDHYYPIILAFTVCATQDIEHPATY